MTNDLGCRYRAEQAASTIIKVHFGETNNEKKDSGCPSFADSVY